eukprot:GHVS01086361.1.p1 GENE.GHVS01086361.1~~GHVS01086361.1.p1  ORF type:complete len:308 (+),score=32.89 GHVS01086361.1:46-924(+)
MSSNKLVSSCCTSHPPETNNSGELFLPSPPTHSSPSKPLVMVIGCSTGFGKAIVETASPIIGPAHYLLMGKNLQEMLALSKSTLGGEAAVRHLDMCKGRTDVERDFDSGTNGLPKENFSHIYMFLNSGTFDASYIPDALDLVEDSVTINVTSFYVIVAKFLQWTKRLQHPPTSVRLVNISSLLAVMPHNGCSLYCASKAYRETVMQVTALETKEAFKDFKCLSFCPGPMRTKMMDHLASSTVVELKGITERPTEFYMCPSRSACTMWRVLKEDEFTSGDRLDACDISEPRGT